MLAAVALAQDCWLVPYGPNTDTAFAVKARIEVDAQRGLTGRGSRRPQAQALRFALTWECLLKSADFATARAAALQAQDQPFLVPFWPAARLTTDAAAMTSALTVAWTAGWATWAINPVSLAPYTFYAPLLFGRLTQPPRLKGRQSDNALAEFSFVEDAKASAALIPPVVADSTFPTPDAYAAAVFPFRPDPAAEPQLSLPSTEVERQALGPGREQSTVFYPQIPEDALQPTFKFRSSAAAIGLLGWWLRRGGGSDSFWIASTQSIGRPSRDLVIGDTTIPAVSPIKTRVGDTLALVTSGKDPLLVRVSSLPGGVVNLGSALAVARPATWTIVAPAILARHADEELVLEFRRADADWIAASTLAFREVPFEYNVTDGETRGTTVGRLAPYAWLFRVDLDFSGAVQSWFLTNYESGCTTSDAQVWEWHDCDFDKLVRSLDLEDDSCSFKIRWWPGCPWENWRPGQLAGTGTLTILRATVAADGTVGAPTARWQGILAKPERDGPLLDVKVLGSNSLFAQKAPRQLMVKQCYKRLYGPRCGLLLADWTFSGHVTAVGANTATLGTFLRVNTDPLPDGFGFADWFALGWVQWNNGAGQPLRSEVLASTAISGGGEITVTLGRPVGFIVGAVIHAVPGCDRMKATCWNYDAGRTDPNGLLGKFNNWNNYGGFDAMPAVAPNFIIPQRTETPAKK